MTVDISLNAVWSPESNDNDQSSVTASYHSSKRGENMSYSFQDMSLETFQDASTDADMDYDKNIKLQSHYTGQRQRTRVYCNDNNYWLIVTDRIVAYFSGSCVSCFLEWEDALSLDVLT